MIKTYKNKEEWLKARSEGIGGSEAGCVSDVNPYKSRAQLLKEKITGKVKNIKETDAIRLGKRMELPMIAMYKGITQPREIRPNENFTVYIHPEYEFLRYTPDATYITSSGDKGVLEIKTTTISTSNPITNWIGKIPDYYVAQLFHGLLVNPEWKEVNIFAFIQRQDDYGYYAENRMGHYMRKDVQVHLDALLQDEIAFWKEVEDGKKNN